MDTDYEGDLIIDGEIMRGKNEGQLARIRNEKIGFVFQFHYLLNEFTVLKNVMLPGLKLQKYTEAEVEHRAMERLKTLGDGNPCPEKSQSAIRRRKTTGSHRQALINDPIIIMGDEPTGNLDKKNSDLVFDIFKRLCEEYRQTLLIVTHDPSFAESTQRIIEMGDGRIINQ
jgi:lipoprotein-releasing system ATP-binding protein